MKDTTTRSLEEQLKREMTEMKKENQRLEKYNSELENRLVSHTTTNGHSDSDSLIQELTKEREALKGQVIHLLWT